MIRKAVPGEWAALFRAVRLRRGVSMREVAQEVGVTLKTIHNWETGKNEPGVSLFVVWARACGYTVELREDTGGTEGGA